MRAVMGTEFPKQASTMGFYRVAGQVQLIADCVIGHAARDSPQYLSFSIGQGPIEILPRRIIHQQVARRLRRAGRDRAEYEPGVADGALEAIPRLRFDGDRSGQVVTGQDDRRGGHVVTMSMKASIATATDGALSEAISSIL